MKSTLLAAAALLTTTHAATVSLTTTPCLDPSYATEAFTVELSTDNTAVPVDLSTVCGLRILSVSDSAIDIRSLQCQAFRDAAGQQKGSTVFTFDKPALIATNPVAEKAVLCVVGEGSSPANGGNSTSSARSTLAAETLVITSSLASASASARLPGASGNATVPSMTMKPTMPSEAGGSATRTSAVPTASNNVAGGAAGLGAGVVFAALMALLL